MKKRMSAGERSLAAEISRHRKAKDYWVDLLIREIELPRFYVRSGLLQVERMTSLPFARYLADQRQYITGRTVTDMGCGTGLLGVVAAKLDAEFVTLSDCTTSAALCACVNTLQYNLGLRTQVLKADLFDHPKHPKEVEVIIFNAPFSDAEPDPDDDVSVAFVSGPDLLPRFFAQARQRLPIGGDLFMPYRHAAGEHNDPWFQGIQHGFRVLSKCTDPSPNGVGFGSPLVCYHLRREE